MLGQYRGPTPTISPLYMADLCRFDRTMRAVSDEVCVIQQETCSDPGGQPSRVSPDCSTWNNCSMSRVSWKANRVGTASPFCSAILLKSRLRPRTRGGVPVLKRRSSMPISIRLADNVLELKSPSLPPSFLFCPICISPRRNVPVVTTTHFPRNSMSRLVLHPTTAPPLYSRPVTVA